MSPTALVQRDREQCAHLLTLSKLSTNTVTPLLHLLHHRMRTHSRREFISFMIDADALAHQHQHEHAKSPMAMGEQTRGRRGGEAARRGARGGGAEARAAAEGGGHARRRARRRGSPHRTI